MVTFALAARKGEEKLGIDGEEVQNFGIYLIAIGWVFSHFFNVLFYEPHKVLEDPLELFKFWGSISSYGGLFGGIIAAWIWRVRNKEKGLPDVVRPRRLGPDLLMVLRSRGLCFGSRPPRCSRLTSSSLISGWPDGTTRHDLGLYEALWWAVICTTVLVLDRKPRPRGVLPRAGAHPVRPGTIHRSTSFELDPTRVATCATSPSCCLATVGRPRSSSPSASSSSACTSGIEFAHSLQLEWRRVRSRRVQGASDSDDDESGDERMMTATMTTRTASGSIGARRRNESRFGSMSGE